MREVAPGIFEGGNPGNPAPSVPTVTPRQARLAMLGAGLLSSVESAISAMSDPEKTQAKIVWEYATEIRRDDALLNSLATTLDLTSAQVDALFAAAALL